MILCDQIRASGGSFPNGSISGRALSPIGQPDVFLKVRRCTFERPFGDVDFPHAGHDDRERGPRRSRSNHSPMGEVVVFSKET